MRSFVVIALCIGLLAPIRLAIVHSARAEMAANETGRSLSGQVGKALKKARRSFELKAPPGKNVVAQGITDGIDRGVANVKEFAHTIASAGGDVRTTASCRNRGNTYLARAGLYIDAIVVAGLLSILAKWCSRRR